jgi:hypothetical protein
MNEPMKKTKKQKLLADLRRKIARVEEQIEKPADMLLDTLPEKKTMTAPKTISFAQVVKTPPRQSKTLTIDYKQITKDLRKTILFSLLIIAFLLTLKMFLK